MKKVLLVVVVMLMGVKGWGQNGYFNYMGGQRTIFYRDTVSNPNCLWNIGVVNKPVFHPQAGILMGIVTDTLNPVLAKDTSVFYIKYWRESTMEFFINFRYMLDGDSTDFGKIEISPDSGNHWVDLLKEDTLYNITWLNGIGVPTTTKPKLNGSVTGYNYFFANLTTWEQASSGYPVLWNQNGPNDTIIIRFTYLTDSNSTPHDGWFIGEINFRDWHDGINETIAPSIISIAPNPVNDVLHIKRKIAAAKNEAIQVMNMMGAVVLEVNNFSGEMLDVSRLLKGVYLLRYSCDKGEARERFVKE